MKFAHFLALFLCLGLLAHAGNTTPSPAIVTPSEPWVTPTLDIRLRYEYGDINSPALQSANALTVRERIGLVTRDIYGFSALIEGEFLQVITNRYDSGPGASTYPNNPNLTGIYDPKTNELNQAYLQYDSSDTLIRAGRQRIILDNAAFVGNVGWRQNEQTYDAFSIQNECIDDLKLFYAYANRANRIFGSYATGALRSFAGDINLFNASYTGFGDATLTAYAYLMNFDKTAANAGYISNNTYGLIATSPLGPVTLYAELALQTNTSSSPPTKPDETGYAHLYASAEAGESTFTLGWEYLGAGFVTPLATVHSFNGYADAFINPRIGLVTNPGLNDLHLRHALPLPFWDLNFTQTIHLFGDNNSRFDYGWEYDLTLSKKFNEHFVAITKLAYFDSAGPTAGPIPNPAPFDTTRVSLELNYHF
ncbi:hypothetical protein [Haloferula sp.]|uniref:hypothetical protein n=1 Tax=Haloferula sp. TaxID=2497595 RepID=UPI003C7082B0